MKKIFHFLTIGVALVFATAAQAANPPSGEEAAPTMTGASHDPPLGFNYFHAFYCLGYIDPTGNQWTYIFSKEAPSEFFVVENISYWAEAFRAACPNGGLVGIHVINSTTGAFDEVAVFGPGF